MKVILPDSPDEEGQSDLDARVKDARERNGLDKVPPASAGDRSIGLAARSGIEFVAAIAVAAGLGVLIDRWLHSSPAALLILLVLGFAAGLLNVYRAMNNEP